MKVFNDASYERILNRSFFSLRFPEPLESSFKSFFIQQNIKRIFLALLSGWIVFSCFAFLDAFLYPQFKNEFWFLRFVVLSPPVVALLIYIYTVKEPPHDVVQRAFAGSVIAAGLIIIYILVRTQSDLTQPYFGGLLLVIFYAHAFSGLRFPYASFATVFLTITYVIILVAFLSLPLKLQMNNIFGLVGSNLIGMLSSFAMEKYIRKDFIYTRLLEQKSSHLKKRNQELEIISTVDYLTGVLNRRGFEQRFEEELKRAQRFSYPVSLFLIDIDDFKAFNDLYGHVKGDECLKQVAEVLSKHARRVADVVARYGGEEFLVLLPGLKSERALQVAESMRRGVEDLSIPHENGSPLGVVTVSIGGVTAVPTPSTSPLHLIQVADAAMYSVKRNGKNAVKVYSL